MKRPDSADLARLEAMQNTTLLSVLGEAVESEKENYLPSPSSSGRGRKLTIEQEFRLVQNLAFLASYSDDPNRATAICVEETKKQDGLILRIASSHGDMSHVVDGFVKIAKMLKLASRREKSEQDDKIALLRHIVKLDHARILCRLRSKHAIGNKKHGRAPLFQSLIKATQDESIGSDGGIERRKLREIRRKGADLYSTFLDFEEQWPGSNRATELLVTIICQAHDLAFRCDLAHVLSTSPTLEEGLRDQLPKTVGKLGKYHSIGSALIFAAREHGSMLSRMSVETCKIATEPSIQSSELGCNLDLALREAFASRAHSDMAIIKPSAEIRMRKRFPQLDRLFQFRNLIRSKSWKVHPEIQLLLFYELHPERRKPRVICSSKSACYLCSLFVKLHGQFYMPRSHAMPHEKWTLPGWVLNSRSPATQNLLEVVRSFILTIQQEIHHLSVDQKADSGHLNEGTITMSDPWSSTRQTRSSSFQWIKAAMAVPLPESVASDSGTTGFLSSKDGISPSIIPVVGAKQPSRSSSRSSANKMGPLAGSSRYSLGTSRLSNAPKSPATLENVTKHTPRWPLLQGDQMTLSRLNRDFQLESQGMHLALAAETEPYQAHIEWLDSDYAATVDKGAVNVINLKEITAGVCVDIAIPSPTDGLYLYANGDMVFVRYELLSM